MMSNDKRIERYRKNFTRGHGWKLKARQKVLTEIHFETSIGELELAVLSDAELQHVYQLLKTTKINTSDWRKLIRLIRNNEYHNSNKHTHGVADKIQAASELPKTAEKLLYFVLPESAREHLPGDLEEEYRTTILPKFGPRYAKIWYWKQAVGSIGPILRSQMLKLFGLASVAKVAQCVSQRFGF